MLMERLSQRRQRWRMQKQKCRTPRRMVPVDYGFSHSPSTVVAGLVSGPLYVMILEI